MSAATCCKSVNPKHKKDGPYLTSEGNWGLVQTLLLGVADVGRNDLVEREPMVWVGKLVAQCFGLDGKLASHSVMQAVEGGVDVLESEGAHCGQGYVCQRRLFVGGGVPLNRSRRRPLRKLVQNKIYSGVFKLIIMMHCCPDRWRVAHHCDEPSGKLGIMSNIYKR